MKYKCLPLPVLQLLLIAVFFYCSAYRKAPANNVPRLTVTAGTNDSLAATKSITGFLRWYKANMRKANGFMLVPKSSKGYYVVDAKACAGYLAFLKSSHFIAPKYADYWQRFFDDKGVLLRKEKLRSDIPEGFDTDLVLLTQEPDLVLNEIDKLTFTVITMKKAEAVIGARLPSDSIVQYEFDMYKRNKSWQIGYISTPNFD